MDGVVNTVFIVEDADEVRAGLSRLLAAAGYRVRSFMSAEAFLREQDEAEPGCLLLDVFLPGTPDALRSVSERLSFTATTTLRSFELGPEQFAAEDRG